MKMNIVLRYCGNKTEAETLHEAIGPWFFWGSTNEILREEWDGTKEDETPVWHRKLGSNRGQRVFYNNKWIEKVEDWHGICITSIVKLFIVSFAQILYQQYQISASDCRHSQPYKKCTAPCRTLKPQRTLTWPNFICYLTFMSVSLYLGQERARPRPVSSKHYDILGCLSGRASGGISFRKQGFRIQQWSEWKP